MTRPLTEGGRGRPRSEQYPVLVLDGPVGSGKTTTLTAMTDAVNARVPFVLVDFDQCANADPVQILAAMVVALSRRCGRYTPLRFPRFLLGMLAMSPGPELDTDDETARAQLAAVINTRRSLDALVELARKQARGVPVTTTSDPVNAFMAARLSGAFHRRCDASRRRLPINLARWQDWYRGQDVGLDNNPLNELLDLNRNGSDPDRAAVERVTEVLCGAFLADLCDSFAHDRLSDEWSLNCMLLADNADVPVGRWLIGAIADRRALRCTHGTDNADPLTVVVGSRGSLLAELPTNQISVFEPDERSYEEHRARQITADAAPWLRYGLPPFTEPEIHSLAVAAVPQARRQRQLKIMVQQLTGGHPEATSLVLDAARRLHNRRDDVHRDACPEPARILAEPVPATLAASASVEQWLLRRLISDLPRRNVEDLVTTAAARDAQHALMLSARGDLLNDEHVTFPRSIETALWDPRSPRPTLLRWLLLRRLAARRTDENGHWSAVHLSLRRACQGAGNESDEMYYALAAGDLPAAVVHLMKRLKEESGGQWLALLTSITAAPRRPQAGTPTEQMAMAIAGEMFEDATASAVANILAGMWVLADPLTGPQRGDVHHQLAASFDVVASAVSSDGDRLRREASRHRQEEALWDWAPETEER